MAGSNEEKVFYKLEPTPIIGERMLVLYVRETFFDDTIIPVRGTPLADFMSERSIPKGDSCDANKYGSYILTEPLPKEAGCLRYAFVKNKTVEDILTPIREPYERYDAIAWPDELLLLYGVEGYVTAELDAGTIGGDNTALSKARLQYLDRYYLTRGGTFETRIEVQEFFSPTPFTENFSTQPMPSPIYYNYLGMRNELHCLHDIVTVPELLSSGKQIPDFGMQNSNISFEGFTYPATNFKRWAPYPKERIKPESGGWYKTREIHFPPPRSLPVGL